MATAAALTSQRVPEADAAIAVAGLVKRYNKVTAVAGIDLEVARAKFLLSGSLVPLAMRSFRHRD